MRNDIRPIPTLYNGITYRSRMEARWAIFFNLGGISVRYEFEGFKTSAGWYLPDFEFKETERPAYFEVKPQVPNDEEWGKMKALANMKKADVFVAIGAPEANYFVWKVLPDWWQEQWYFVSDDEGFVSYMMDGTQIQRLTIRTDPTPAQSIMSVDVPDLMEKAERHQFEIYDDAKRRQEQGWKRIDELIRQTKPGWRRRYP